jgi:hypothetical protein
MHYTTIFKGRVKLQRRKNHTQRYNYLPAFQLGLSIIPIDYDAKKANFRLSVYRRTYGVMVSTLDFESNNPSSILGMSFFRSLWSSSCSESLT